MKKSIVLLAVLICFTVAGNAQPFHGGLLGGFSASQVDGDSYWGFNKLGFQLGVFVNTRLSDLFTAQLEIKYTGKGAKQPPTQNNPDLYSLTLHYIDIPLSVNFKIRQIGSVELGIIPGYLFAEQGKDSGGPLPSDFLVTFKKFDLSTLIGVNVNLTKKLALNLRYCYSLISIRDSDATNNYYTWFGKLLGNRAGSFGGTYNNYLTTALYYQLR
jgi:opacity protein-like surface antigen